MVGLFAMAGPRGIPGLSPDGGAVCNGGAQDALLSIDALLSDGGAPVATEELFAKECVELARLLMWAGQVEEAEQVRIMAVCMTCVARPMLCMVLNI